LKRGGNGARAAPFLFFPRGLEFPGFNYFPGGGLVVNRRPMNDGEVSAWHYSSRQPVRVRWRDGVIMHLEPAAPPPPHDLWMAPTLFDLQINGYGGVDFQQDNLT